MKTLLTLGIGFIISFNLQAQQIGALQFIEDTHDFGTVKEDGGPITHRFQFVNGGANPVTISNVKASCGCTTPGWSKEAIAPGDTGYVEAQYNPMNRPGSFRKSLTISSDAPEGVRMLFIKGNVTPRVKTPEDLYPTVMGGIRMKYRSLNMER